jgi:hypothetical protein
MGLGAFGTAPLFIDALDKRYGGGLRYKAIHLGEVYFLENHQGIIDTAFRRFQLTARQAQQKFVASPGGSLPDRSCVCLDDPAKLRPSSGSSTAVSPREDYDPKRADYKGMRYADCYIAEAGKMIGDAERGFNTFPYPDQPLYAGAGRNLRPQPRHAGAAGDQDAQRADQDHSSSRVTGWSTPCC